MKLMKNKLIFILFLVPILLLFILNTHTLAGNINVSVSQEKRNPAKITVTDDVGINRVKIYKKYNDKYILIMIKMGDNLKSVEILLPVIRFSTTEDSKFKVVVEDADSVNSKDITVPKIPAMPTINPEETAKPSWSPSPVPTKPTPSVSPSSSASPSSTSTTSPSPSTSPQPSSSPSPSASPSPSGVTPSTTGNTYYVSTSGNDSNDGKSAAKPFKTINKGISKLSAGDKLIIKAGTYKENKLSINKSGSKNKPITIQADGKVIIDGKNKSNTLLTFTGNAKYVTISGIKFQNLKGKETRAILIKASANNITIDNCEFYNIICSKPKDEDGAANAIYFEGSGKTEGSAIKNITVKNCTLKKINAGYSEMISIDCNCRDITIDGVTCAADGVTTNIAICVCGNDTETNSNKSLNRPQNVVIKNCNVSGCRSPYNQDSYGIYVDGAKNVQITNNTVTNCTGGIEVGAEHQNSKCKNHETESIVVQNNKVSTCNRGMYIGGFDSKCGYAKNVTVTGNTFTNCGKKDDEVITFDRCNTVKFTNNILTSKKKVTMIYKTSKAKNLTIKDNKITNGK